MQYKKKTSVMGSQNNKNKSSKDILISDIGPITLGDELERMPKYRPLYAWDMYITRTL